eukprot:gene17073-biopygen781
MPRVNNPTIVAMRNAHKGNAILGFKENRYALVKDTGWNPCRCAAGVRLELKLAGMLIFCDVPLYRRRPPAAGRRLLYFRFFLLQRKRKPYHCARETKLQGHPRSQNPACSTGQWRGGGSLTFQCRSRTSTRGRVL